MHTQAFSACPVVYLCVHQMVKWTICCGFQSRTALCRGRRPGFSNDWKIKASWKANLTPFLLWWLSWPISCRWVARRLESHTYTHMYSRCVNSCVQCKCLHAYTYSTCEWAHAHTNTSTDASCCWWQSVCWKVKGKEIQKTQKDDWSRERQRWQWWRGLGHKISFRALPSQPKCCFAAYVYF